MAPSRLTQVPQAVLDLNGDLEELVYIKAIIGIYDRTMLEIVNSTTTPAQLNLRPWVLAAGQVESSIFAPEHRGGFQSAAASYETHICEG
ncbi:hypothetical protein N7453_008856 [Penicillium expansum]|nr:hypothetical protein N7453_008856 [Penicillium expansum]